MHCYLIVLPRDFSKEFPRRPPKRIASYRSPLLPYQSPTHRPSSRASIVRLALPAPYLRGRGPPRLSAAVYCPESSHHPFGDSSALGLLKRCAHNTGGESL
jgi:hypothetical protein